MMWLGLLALAWTPAAQSAEMRGPAWMASHVLVYASFDAGTPSPERLVQGVRLKENSAVDMADAGLFGSALRATERTLALEGDRLSPHRPLTLMFWWRLERDHPVDGYFGWYQFTGRGFTSAFSRGKGEWCALTRPAGVMQVYHLPGIPNVNHLFDLDLARSLDLRGGVWHHLAAVFRPGSEIVLYLDGKRAAEVTTQGRGFRAEDGLRTLDLGPGLVLDEVIILERALEGEQIEEYLRGIEHMRIAREGLHAAGRADAAGSTRTGR